MTDVKQPLNPVASPGTRPEVAKGERKRIPMSVPRRKMEVPELPGYHLHWFLEGRVPLALQGGYEFVKIDEMPINQFCVATDKEISGSSDLGTNISIVSGTGADGKSENLILMKIKEQWWLDDQAAVQSRNAEVMKGIFTNEEIPGADKMSAQDKKLAYVKQADVKTSVPLLNRPPRKGG